MTGWYDPTVGTTLTTNVPADPDPHWEARGFGVIEGGTQEIVDFAVTGTAGQTTTVSTPSQQRVDFDISGTVGQREITLPAGQEITEFTFAGQAAEAVGNPEYWALDFTGSSDAASSATPGTSEEFFIYTTGNSATQASANAFFDYGSLTVDDNVIISTGERGHIVWYDNLAFDSSGVIVSGTPSNNPNGANGCLLYTSPSPRDS